MRVSYTIGLYQGFTRLGELELDSVFVMEPADYTCEPKSVVTYDEVAQIAKALRREPETHAGVLGNCEWREELHPPKAVRTFGPFSSTA